MLNHLYVFPTQTEFDRKNIATRIEAADTVLYSPKKRRVSRKAATSGWDRYYATHEIDHDYSMND